MNWKFLFFSNDLIKAKRLQGESLPLGALIKAPSGNSFS
jgi:hypothetical protein